VAGPPPGPPKVKEAPHKTLKLPEKDESSPPPPPPPCQTAGCVGPYPARAPKTPT